MTGKGTAATPDKTGSQTADLSRSTAVSDDAVLEHLRRNPDLLSRHPNVYEALIPPSRSDGNVVDIQGVMLQRLRDENLRLRGACEAVIGTARINRTFQARVHDSVLQILAAGSLEKLIHTATADLPQVLDADAITICLESGDNPIPRGFASCLRCLPQGMVDCLLGPEGDVVSASDIEGDPVIFGPVAGLIRSQVLSRLRISERAPRGLLAIGARDRDAFSRTHGFEPVGFLTRVLEGTIRRWLGLPN